MHGLWHGSSIALKSSCPVKTVHAHAWKVSILIQFISVLRAFYYAITVGSCVVRVDKVKTPAYSRLALLNKYSFCRVKNFYRKKTSEKF